MAQVFRSRKPRQKLLESLKCMAEIGSAIAKHEDKNKQARLQDPKCPAEVQYAIQKIEERADAEVDFTDLGIDNDGALGQ